MAYVKVLRCDECGSQKNQVNHWFAMEVAADDVFENLMPNGSVVASKMADLTEEDAENMKHYCGQQCAGKAFHRWLDTGSLEKPATTHDPDNFDSSATLIEEKP